MFLYFQSSGCIMLSTDRKIQGFKLKVSSLHHLPLFVRIRSTVYDYFVINFLPALRAQLLLVQMIYLHVKIM